MHCCLIAVQNLTAKICLVWSWHHLRLYATNMMQQQGHQHVHDAAGRLLQCSRHAAILPIMGKALQAAEASAVHQLFVPRHRRSTFGRRAFSVAGPAAWNSLPDYLRDPSRSFDSFHWDQKTFLVLLAYTAHQRLCDCALYKSTVDTDINCESSETNTLDDGASFTPDV